MIQRKQTLWLILAIIALAATVPFATYVGADANGTMQMIKGSSSSLLAILTSAVIVLNLIAIFLFKNRKNQIRLILLAVVTLLVLWFGYFKEIQNLATSGSYAITALLHVVALILMLLAVKYIYDDEKLIKESDRLR
jgi:drug/metabolite transporter (DMT)-like permease